MRFCASARTFTSLASRSAFRCWEMAGGESLKRPAISPAQSAPLGQHFDNALAGGIGEGREMGCVHAASISYIA